MLHWLFFGLIAHASLFTNDDAWDGRSRTVPYCVEIEAGWRHDPVWTHEHVRAALDRWRAFFWRYEFEQRHLAFEPTAKCTPENGGLRVLIGDAPAGTPRFAAGAGGSVFVDVLTPRAHFSHVLLNELGRYFGVPVDSVPVMRERAHEVLENPAWQAHLGKIEMSTWRYALRAGDVITFADGSAPNRGLPAAFGLAAGGTHGARLAVEELNEEGLRLSLAIHDEHDRPHLRLHGDFRWRSSPARGLVCARLLMAPTERNVPREADGFFEDADGRSYPAVLEAAPGSLLRVFIPHSRRWWSVEDYASVKLWLRP